MDFRSIGFRTSVHWDVSAVVAVEVRIIPGNGGDDTIGGGSGVASSSEVVVSISLGKFGGVLNVFHPSGFWAETAQASRTRTAKICNVKIKM